MDTLRDPHRLTEPARPPLILLIDDDPGAIQLLGGILAKEAALRFATNGRDALRLAQEFVPDLILLDAEMPGMSGFQLLQACKGDPHLADVPVIFITGHTEAGFEVSALDMGAADFIAKPFRSSLVLARVRTHLRMKRMADELRHAATTDPLTGIANRRSFDVALQREWSRAQRAGEPLSLIVITVDRLDDFRDHHGGHKGDDCLRVVAQALLTACHRPGDLVARYGEREFMILLPHTPRHGADTIAQRARLAVERLNVAQESSPAGARVGVSVGMACHDESSGCAAIAHTQCSAGDLVAAADTAMRATRPTERPHAPVRAA
jgi:diguanylate cyclase (GGDEF)-like protein